MKIVQSIGNYHYELTGEREEEAARFLEEAITSVNKRRNGYIEGELESIMKSIADSFGVQVKTVYE